MGGVSVWRGWGVLGGDRRIVGFRYPGLTRDGVEDMTNHLMLVGWIDRAENDDEK